MRSLLGASLAIAATASSVIAAHAPPTRKSLAFGPVHPHKRFDVAPEQLTSFTRYTDPLELARAYAADLTRHADAGHSFVIRDDSYTDDRTGVSHIYIRQLINGVEVADGNLNLNIKDGQILSFGNSFYQGESPAVGVDPALEEAASQSTYCRRIEREVDASQASLDALMSSGQVILGGSDAAAHLQRVIRPLSTALNHNCGSLGASADLHEPGSMAEPRKAALLFMMAAHPSENFAADIRDNFKARLNAISSTFETHLVGKHESPVEVLHNVPGTVGPVRTRLAYVQTPTEDGTATTLNLVWKMEVEMQDNWYEAAISVSDPTRIVEVLDWASDSSPASIHDHSIPDASYNVWAWGINDPPSGKRTIEKNPYDKAASPLGWHTLPVSKDPLSKGVRTKNPGELIDYTTTWGNNVFAHEDWEGRNNWVNNYRPDAGESRNFDYEYNLQAKNGSWIHPHSYINLTVTQLFYTANIYHDFLYRYGFDEKSGNFQQYNFGKGGAENDAVIANAQDGSGYNNANFMTPPDGTNGRCRMYIWNVHGAPFRDGDLEAGIVIHEYSHGLSTRLTGGPKDSGCLGWGESGGMGEGWGDFLATVIRSTSTYSDFSMGSWAANETNGIRNYLYSTDKSVNPSTYKTIDGYWGVHAIGEVWAEILYVVLHKLINKHGYNDNLFPPAPLEDGTIPEGDFYRPADYTAAGEQKPLVPKHGNTLMVQLVINAMKLQPCRPSFFDARDAIVQADKILTGGENLCTIWEGFSERGLGPKATVKGSTPWGGGIRTNDFKLPKACRKAEEPEEPEEPTPEDPEPEDPFLF